MKTSSRRLYRASAMAGILCVSIMSMGSFAPAGDDSAYIRDVRMIRTDKLGLEHPAGLAFLRSARAFAVMDAPKQNEISVSLITPYRQLLSTAGGDIGAIDPTNLTFDEKFNRLLAFESASGDLLQIEATVNGEARGLLKIAKRFQASPLGIQNPRGMTIDPATGSVYILDSSGSKIIRIHPGIDGDLDATAALSKNRASSQSLRKTGIVSPQGLAFEPGTGHLHVLSPQDMKLYELTTAGEVVTTRDLSQFRLADPQGMVFAPSSDPTDDPSNINLFVADAGSNSKSKKKASGKVVEFSFAAPAALDATVPTIQPSLIKVTATSAYSPPSPDTTGVAYISDGVDPYKGNLLICDSEVDEFGLWNHVNVWLADLSGAQTPPGAPVTLTTENFSTDPKMIEPTGISYDPASRDLFFSNDDLRAVQILHPGPDGLYNTSDDTLTQISTEAFGSMDTEDVTFCPGTPPHLFIIDGVGEEVYDVSAGPNGVFDGVPSAGGDDEVTHFDTTVLGIIDPEGIYYNPANDHLYIQSDKAHSIAETTRDGVLVQYIDLTALHVESASGLTYAPASDDPSKMDFYISARGYAYIEDPSENDGKLFEISIDRAINNPEPTATSLSPSSGWTGGAAFTLTVNGTNFARTSIVQWNGSDRATTYISSTRLKAAISAADMILGQSVPVTVYTPPQGGGTSNALTFTVKNPLPTTTGLDPTNTFAAGPAFTLTVNGTGFVPNSVVRWNKSNRTTTYVSPTQLQAAITAVDIATGKNVPVTVYNAKPSGGTSNAQNFPIYNPVPTVTSLSPTNAYARALKFTLTVNGTRFVSGASVLWNGSPLTTTFSSSTKLTASVMPANIPIAGTAQVSVLNPQTAGPSNALNVTINDPPVPTISSVSPSSRTAGTGSFTLTVSGTGFVSDSTVYWNGAPLVTTVSSATKLTTVIAADAILVGQTVSVTAVTPNPGGGPSNAKTFTVNNPVPTATDMSPSTANRGAPGFTLTVNGTGFVTTSVVRWNGSGRTTTYVSPTQLTATITAQDIATAKTVPVTVYNPKPAGGTSAALSFTVY